MKDQVENKQLDDKATLAEEQLNAEFQELLRDLKLGKYGARAIEAFINTVIEINKSIKTK